MPLAVPVSLGGGIVTIVPVGVYIGSWLTGTGAFEIEAGGKGQEAMTLEGMRSPPEPVAYPWYWPLNSLEIPRSLHLPTEPRGSFDTQPLSRPSWYDQSGASMVPEVVGPI